MKPERTHYLYRITNTVNNKIYIGQTVDPNSRWRAHRRDAATPKLPIHFAIHKYGNDAFAFDVIACCRNQDDANEIETLLVKQYESHVSTGKGYNATHGGMNAPKSEAWKAKIRQHHSDPKYKAEQSERAKKFWASLSIEGRQQFGESISLATVGISKPGLRGTRPKEVGEKISVSLTGRRLSEAHRAKLSAAKLGKPSPKKGKPSGLFAWNKGIVKVYPPELIQQLQDLSVAGLSQNKIAKQLRLAKTTVRKLQKVA